MPNSFLNTFRTVLYIAIGVVAVMAYQAWENDHPKPISAPIISEAPKENILPSNIQMPFTQMVPTEKGTEKVPVHSRKIRIKTDVLDVMIDPVGGQITDVTLPQYKTTLSSNQPVQLLNDNPATRYVASSGLLGPTGPDTATGIASWQTDRTQYVLSPGADRLDIPLHYQNTDGVLFTKIFTFHRNDYEVDISWTIQNNGSKPWYGNPWLKLSRTNTPPEIRHGIGSFATYFGAALSTPEKVYQKISFKEMDKSTLNQTAANGWIAMIQHYFVSAFVPEKGENYRYFSQQSASGLYTIGALGPVVTVEPGKAITKKATFYAGPAIADSLEKVAPHLDLTVDYGWLWMISAALFWLMQKIHSIIGNWGWSIVLVTFLIKLAFYQLSAKSYRSMGALRKLQPKINALRERYKDDKQKLTQATLELYKTEKVNPMGGCLPVLIQIPVFIALYWVLVESIQLRQAPFIFWIRDLSVADPYFVLPILMGLSMFVQQRLSPPPPDPTQAKIMMLMPVFFTVMFAAFPAGLMLYWFVNNSLSCLQQWIVMKAQK